VAGAAHAHAGTHAGHMADEDAAGAVNGFVGVEHCAGMRRTPPQAVAFVKHCLI
jgi:pyrimidine deaminase RibD-like protein